jgi:hypothetical protein
MLIDRMHLEFRIALDKLDSSAYPDILPEQVDYFLNEAQERFVKTRYSGNNLLQASFEEIQKRTDDLNNIVITRFGKLVPLVYEPTTLSVDLNTLYEDEDCITPTQYKYMIYLMGRCKTGKLGCEYKYRNLRIYNHDKVQIIRKHPFKKPVMSEPIAYFENKSLHVVTEGNFNAEVTAITFLRRPVEMQYGSVYPTPTTDVSCELAEHTHKEIIQLAVFIALENIESPRQQTTISNIQSQE